MKNLIYIIAVAGISATLFLSFNFRPPSDEVQYPEGYRGWTYIKSMIIEEGHPLYESFGGIHNIYANKKALEGYKSDTNTFPDGAVIIFDLLEAVNKDHAITAGLRKVVGVMERNSEKFKSTGGWGFEGFKGDTKERAITDAYSQCFNCHLSKKESNYVFSTYHE